MNKIWTLTKVLFKNGSQKTNKKKKLLASWLGKIILFSIFAYFVIVPGVKFLSKTYDFLAMMHQQGVIISLGFSLSTMLIFIFSLGYVLTVFYFSKDINILLPLPLKDYEIISAKLITILMYEYLTELFIVAPLLGIYGVKGSLGALYWISAVLIFLILPIIPLVLAGLINMIIMSLTNLSKHKDMFKTLGGIFGVLIGFGINILIHYTRSRMSQEELMNILTSGNNSLVKIMSSFLPNVKWATYSLIGETSNERLLNLLLLILVSVLSIAIFILVAKKLYFKGVIGSSETYSKRQKIDQKGLEKNTKQNSKIKAYTLKELRLLFRTPTFFVSCVLRNFMILIIFMVATYIDDVAFFSTVSQFFSNPNTVGMALGITFGFIMFIGGTNIIASTAISREGQNMYINKYLPISYKEQILSKVFSAMLINLVNVLILVLILIFVAKLPIIMSLGIFLLGLLASFMNSGFGIILDIHKPKLNWDSEQKAVKQNGNAFKSSLISWIISGLSIFLALVFKPSLMMAIVAIVTASLLIISLLFYYLLTKGERIYSKIE